jgi:hypothetical protein
MLIKNNLHFVSVEGNWNKSIHDERIARAAMVLKENKSSLAIASGTYSPPLYSSFFQGRLGEYTKETLINKYGIPAMRIIPAYLFPYSSTYTIIDAFTNATLIGWVSCGLRKRNNKINVLLEPSTSAFHGLRVEILNNRACKYLHDFGVNIEVSCKNKLSNEILEKEYQGEISRLSEMQSSGALITTGEWLDKGKKKSYDDLHSMKYDLIEAFDNVFKFSSLHMDTCSLTDLERLIFTLLWNQLANSKRLSDKCFEEMYLYIKSNFDTSISNSTMLNMKKIVNELKI